MGVALPDPFVLLFLDLNTRMSTWKTTERREETTEGKHER
jgi:hypothetical protein